jgi:hypothetical protein
LTRTGGPRGVLAWHPFDNVVRITADGEVKCRAERLPEATAWKCWVRIGLVDEELHEWTASYEAVVGHGTGQIVRSLFTK